MVSRPKSQSIVNAPWGTAPTPLLPRAIREAGMNGISLRLNGLGVRPQDLDSAFWRTPGAPKRATTDADCMQLRDYVRRVLQAVTTSTIAPSSLVKSSIMLASLPLRTRTYNALAAQGFSTIGQVAELTYAELMRVPTFGITSLLDLTCCLEAFVHQQSDTQLANVRDNSQSLTEIVTDLLTVFDERELMVLRSRVLPVAATATLEELGQRAGVTRERIRQIEKGLHKELIGRLDQPAFESIRRRAARLREILGSAVPASALESMDPELVPTFQAGDDQRAVTRELMLWVAGPYELRHNWLVLDRTLREKSKQALNRAVSDKQFLHAAKASTALSRLGIAEPHRSQWIDELGGFRKVDEGWVVFRGSLVAKCINWIRYRQAPVLVSELAVVTGTESERSLRHRLLDDQRLKRITRQGHVALREWEQFDEYTGVAEEIAQEIERLGGAASIEHLVNVISARYGVSPNSVRQYASAPMFIRGQDGKLRRRSLDQRLTVDADAADSAGCYFIDGGWSLRCEVTLDTLRGSGRPVPVGFAAAAGCQPGERISFLSDGGDVVLSWPETAASGPNLGSVRIYAEAEAATIGDHLFVTLSDGRARVRLLTRSQLQGTNDPVERLWLLVGLKQQSLLLTNNVWEEIGCAIGLGEDAENAGPEDIRRALNARGERDLAGLIPEGHQTETADAALSRIAGLLS